MVTLTPRPPSWIETAPVLVEESIDIDAPAATVWALVAELRALAESS